MHRPGFEPGYSAWKADIIAARPSVPNCGTYLKLADSTCIYKVLIFSDAVIILLCQTPAPITQKRK